jgi:hypothetical protein
LGGKAEAVDSPKPTEIAKKNWRGFEKLIVLDAVSDCTQEVKIKIALICDNVS